MPVNLKKGSLTLIILVENAAENDGDPPKKTRRDRRNAAEREAHAGGKAREYAGK